MAIKRMQYGLLLAGTGAYYIASGEWISQILFYTVVGLPLLSLLLSLPAILDFRASAAGADILETGDEAELWLLGSSNRPMPPFRGRIRVHSCLTGKDWRYEADQGLSTQHCGGFVATAEKVWISDYLGLFSFPVRRKKEKIILIRPKEVAVPQLTELRQPEANRWIPKSGGGFSENHEHRLYRPGDNLNQVHWKLSAKVGDLILREPMEPVRGAVLLTMTLGGTAEELDRKFGRLLWTGRFLLKKELSFEIRALTGKGLLSCPVDSDSALMKGIDALLCTPCTESGSVRDYTFPASWQYHIGGEPDEA